MMMINQKNEVSTFVNISERYNKTEIIVHTRKKFA